MHILTSTCPMREAKKALGFGQGNVKVIWISDASCVSVFLVQTPAVIEGKLWCV